MLPLSKIYNNSFKKDKRIFKYETLSSYLMKMIMSLPYSQVNHKFITYPKILIFSLSKDISLIKIIYKQYLVTIKVNTVTGTIFQNKSFKIINISY